MVFNPFRPLVRSDFALARPLELAEDPRETEENIDALLTKPEIERFERTMDKELALPEPAKAEPKPLADEVFFKMMAGSMEKLVEEDARLVNQINEASTKLNGVRKSINALSVAMNTIREDDSEPTLISTYLGTPAIND